jgi:hypothetical protein
MSIMSKSKDTTNAGYAYEVRTPVADFAGARCNVLFANGVGRTNNYDDAMACRHLGYAVTDAETGKAMEPKKGDTPAA